MFGAARENTANAGSDGVINKGDHIIDDIKTAADHFNNGARDSAAAIRDDLEGVARRTGSHMRELAEVTSHSFADAGESLAMKIRNNPIQSSLIALGVGLVAGVLYRR